METGIRLQLEQQERASFAFLLVDELVLGRQRAGEPAPIALSGPRRLVVASANQALPEEILRVRLLDAKRREIEVTNLSPRPCNAAGGALLPGQKRTLKGAEWCEVAGRVLRIDATPNVLHALEEPTPIPLEAPAPTGAPLPPLDPAASQRLLAWLRGTIALFQESAGSSRFFESAVRIITEAAALDCARVVEWTGQGWVERTIHPLKRLGKSSPSQYILNVVRQLKSTFWEEPHAEWSQSLVDVAVVVAAPILDRNGDVVAVLYGDKRRGSLLETRPPLTELEAKLVELVATAVASGLARVKEEQAAAATRARLEQFFTPELSRRLLSDQSLLEGRDCQVTVLFCDIRGFSRIAEGLEPRVALEWINEVMQELSVSILEHRGVLVDYVGDEVMAMWGAPDDQENQAELACQAALAIIAKLPSLNQRWGPRFGGDRPIDVGIGINTGVARVGNTGSLVKFKYGPLGHAVNLASRVQGATKAVGARLLVTGATRALLPATFVTRRIGQVRVVNVNEPVELHQILESASPALIDGYAAALEAWEQAASATDDAQRDLIDACVQRASSLLASYPRDQPTLHLLTRAAALKGRMEKGTFEATWTLRDK